MGAASPLSLLMVAQSIILCFGMNWELFIIKNETGRQVRYEAARAVVSVVTFTAGCLFNIAAAAVGRIAEAAFGFMLYRPHINRMAETRPGEFSTIYANSAALTIAAVFPSLALMVSTDWSPRTSPPIIVGSVLLGVLFWLVVLARQKHPLFAELRAVFDKLKLRCLRHVGVKN